MTYRSRRGASLALIITTALVLILIGVAVFFLIQIFGGGSEVHNAVDAGTLNIAKQAIQVPSVPVPTDKAIQVAFQGLSDPQTGGINLLTYNRLVGQAMLVALNAQADGSETAIGNAKKAIAAIQDDQNSIGKALKEALSDATSNNNWAKNPFLSAAARNPMGLSDLGTAITWDPTQKHHYQVGFVGQGEKDPGSSNISLSEAQLANQMPYSDYTQGSQVSWPKGATDGTGKFMRGYREVKIPNVGSIYGVALSGEQPHLISLDKFHQQSNQPGAGSNVAVPPNSFYTMASVPDEKTHTPLTGQSAATVGTANYKPFPLSIPYGFLIIDNSGSATFSGNVPNLDNVAANELGTGIQVDPSSGMFATKESNLIPSWENYNAQQKAASANGGTPPPAPSLAGLYNSDGSPATLQDALKIGTGPAVLCTDFNSDPNDSGADPNCVKGMTPQGGNTLGPFDTAYHPNGGYSQPSSGQGTLTSGEYAKLEVASLYAMDKPPGPPAVFSINAPPTGQRLYPSSPNPNPIIGDETPWESGKAYANPAVKGQVSKDGTMLQLIGQTTSYMPYTANGQQVSTALPPGQTPADELQRFITNRIYQIKPDATQAEINSVLNYPLALGKIYYVYATGTAPNNHITITTTQPPWMQALGGAATAADGTPHVFQKKWDLVNGLGSMANPGHDFDIHDRLFLNVQPGSAVDTLTVTYTPASGAYDLLGTVKFTDAASNQGPPPVFSERN